jgi:DNA-binding transcriptional ArsR family regulator
MDDGMDDTMDDLSVNTKRLARIMKALGNEHRLSLYLQIAQKQEAGFEDNVCVVQNIIKYFHLSAPTISHHLKELSNAGLINTQRRGKFLTASIVAETVDELEQILAIVRSSDRRADS